MSNLVDNPATSAVAVGSAVGAFLGATIAYFTGRDERMERYAARGSVAGGLIAAAYELAYHIARLIGPAGSVNSDVR